MSRAIVSHAPRFALAGCLALLLALGGRPSAAVPVEPDVKELQELDQASYDDAQSERVLTRARALLAQDLNPGYQMFLRQIVLRGLVRSEAPFAEILAAADSLRPLIGEDPRTLVQFNVQVAGAMLQRPGGADHAAAYARRALDAVPNEPAWASARGQVLTVLGAAETERGRHAEAITHLREALVSHADSHAVLLALGKAYERSGKDDEAIDAYVRSLGTFPCQDTVGKASLAALYGKKKKGTKDLDARLEAACKTSRQVIALDANRHEMPAPAWTLTGFDGDTLRLADLAGKVVVIDFWGSWCGPCRAELPYFQAMYERFKDKGVAFVGIAWERANTREEAVKASRRFMEQNNLDFPTVVDHERHAVTAYEVDSFPTVFLIDKTGRVRYRNVGFRPDIDHVLTAQLESLME